MSARRSDSTEIPIMSTYKRPDMVAEPEKMPRNDFDAQLAECLGADAKSRQKLHRIIYSVIDSMLESQEFAEKTEENISVSENLAKIIEETQRPAI